MGNDVSIKPTVYHVVLIAFGGSFTLMCYSERMRAGSVYAVLFLWLSACTSH